MATLGVSDQFDKYFGTWRIVECVSLAGTVDTTGIEGSEFHLDDSGDVSWKLVDETDSAPFFSSDSYEFTAGRHGSVLLKFFGTFREHVIEFKAEISDDLMLLTCERCCMLQCQKICEEDPEVLEQYTYTEALDQGYFHDVAIKADTGKIFKVHSVILSMTAPGLAWTSTPPPLSGLKEDILETVLHYLYTECLPKGLSEETTRDCIKVVGKLPGLENFTQICQSFLKNTALKQQIVSLIADMHACADRIVDLFKCRQRGNTMVPDDVLSHNPAKLCYVMKQALREGAIAFSKYMILCDLFARRSGELPREERHDIIKYTKTRFHIFIKQLHEFFDAFKTQLSYKEPEQDDEIATYFLPELEVSLSTLTKFVEDFKSALDTAISKNISDKEKADKTEKHKKDVKDVLGKTLKHALHIRELKKLKYIHDTASGKFEFFLDKAGRFNRKSVHERKSLISSFLQTLKDREAPLIIQRVEQFAFMIEEKWKWKEWKYLFKLTSSKMAWTVSKLCSYRHTLQPAINELIEIVNKEEFTNSLSMLGLTSETKTESSTKEESKKSTKYAKLSSVESLCISPNARDSLTAKRALDLFKKKQKTDMVFEIIIIHDTGDTVIDHTHGDPIEKTESDRDTDHYEIPAHCVILATRCRWFQRALLSGMRESIDKKITIHDTNPEVFNLFLEFVYGGNLDTSHSTPEQLTELLTLADRYEVDTLKSVCEHALGKHVNNETALYLFSMADQLQAKALKEQTVSYIQKHPVLMEGELYIELPQNLKNEIQALTNGEDSSDQETPNVGDIEDMIHKVDLAAGTLSGSTSSSSTTSSVSDLRIEDPARLEACVHQMKEIVGDDVSDEDLMLHVISADYDVSRAINFYFSSL
ncbi:uncharacterized protein LOC134725615 [Mytilus trossulus]|uniref:uncharacterized protein LOC134725615 n=1 Tax=Mytilus trossulus TaxID=6551 RepID=UPI003005F524